MADFERLIPVDEPEDGTTTTVARSSSFSRASLARFSLQRFRRRGWIVGADDQDKENAAAVPRPTVPGKRVKFDERVYHGPVRSKSASAAAAAAAAVGFPVYRGILKTSSSSDSGRPAVAADARSGCGAVPDRMRMYAMPVTSFYIGAHDGDDCDERRARPRPETVKRPSCVAGGALPHGSKKVRRFGTEIGW